MGDLKEIRRRIKSIESIIKVTNAMEIISASKMRKFQDEIFRIRNYQEKIEKIMRDLSLNNFDKNIYFSDPQEVRSVLLIVFSTHRGLAGALPNTILKAIYDFVNTKNKEGLNIKVINVGLKTAAKVKGMKVDLVADFSDIPEKPTASDMKTIVKMVNKLFLDNEVQEIYAIYPKFINSLVQRVTTQKILPVAQKSNDGKQITAIPFTFEPDKISILDNLMKLYLENLFYLEKTETVSSEYSARMTAMKSASENASKLKTMLTMRYNKTRQSQITDEVMQVTSGAVTSVNS